MELSSNILSPRLPAERSNQGDRVGLDNLPVLRNGVSPILAVSKRLYQEKGLGKVVPVVANPLKLVSEFQSGKARLSPSAVTSDAKKKPGTRRPDESDNWAAKSKGKPQPSRDFSRPVKKKHKRRKEESVPELPSSITIPDSITVRDLAEKMHRSPAEMLKKLMDLGIMATINQEIDFETAEILAALYEVAVEHEVSVEERLLEEIVMMKKP